MAVLKRKIAKDTGWPPERRAQQSARARAEKIWLKSTGPRSQVGKAKSALNSLKHGAYSREMVRVNRALRDQRDFMKLLVADSRARRRYRLSGNDPALKPFDIRPLALFLHRRFIIETARILKDDFPFRVLRI
jgi:hypothetical protein